MKNTTLLFILYSLFTAFSPVIASEEQELIALPMEIIINGITPYLNPAGMAALKQTCKTLDKVCRYIDISPHVIQEIDKITCTKMLSHLAHTQQSQNFAHFFQHNNVEKRKEALKILGWSADSDNVQLMQVHCVGVNTTLPFRWKKIFNNKIALIMTCLNDNLNIQDQYSYTAPMWASSNGQTEIVKLLLDKPNIDINIQNNVGYTVLMFASIYGHIKVVKLLLGYSNININLQNKHGLTALALAYNKKHTEIVQLLEAYGMHPTGNTIFSKK